MKTLAIHPKRKQIVRMGLEQVLRKIQFQDLEIFEAVARLGSSAGAARELRLQPPHVSKSIKRIEVAAQNILFQRSKTGVTLTPEGRRFLDFAQSLAKVISSSPGFDDFENELPKQRLLTLAGTSYLANYLLVPAISETKLSEDRYRFRLIEHGENQLVSLGLKGIFEIAIHSKNLDWPKSWATAAIGKFSWVLCGRVGHPLGSVANEEDVKKYPFVTPISLTGGEFRQGDDLCPLPIRNRVAGDEAQTAEVGLHLVTYSDQLIFVPEIMIKNRIAQGILQKIKVREWHPVRETISLSAHAENVPQKLFEQLIKACEKFTL